MVLVLVVLLVALACLVGYAVVLARRERVPGRRGRGRGRGRSGIRGRARAAAPVEERVPAAPRPPTVRVPAARGRRRAEKR